MAPAPTRVLFVCYANMTRSPLAAGLFRRLAHDRGLADRFVIDSAGISAYEGSAPDPGSVAVAAQHGIALTGFSRQMTRSDLFDHDHVMIADRHVLRQIQRLMGASLLPGALDVLKRVRLLARLANPAAVDSQLDVPDPVGGGLAGYVDLYELLQRACTALLDELAPRP